MSDPDPIATALVRPITPANDVKPEGVDWIHTDEAWPIAGMEVETGCGDDPVEQHTFLGYDHAFSDITGEECMEIQIGILTIPCYGFYWRPKAGWLE